MFPLTWPWIRFNVRFLRHTHILVDPFQQSKFVSISSQQIVFITSPYKRVCSFIYTHFYIIYSAQLYTLSNQTYMLPSYLYMWDDIHNMIPVFPTQSHLLSGLCSPSMNLAFADIPNGLKGAAMVPLAGHVVGGVEPWDFLGQPPFFATDVNFRC